MEERVPSQHVGGPPTSPREPVRLPPLTNHRLEVTAMIYSDPFWTLLAYAIVVGTTAGLFALGIAETAKAIYRRLTRRPAGGGHR